MAHRGETESGISTQTIDLLLFIARRIKATGIAPSFKEMRAYRGVNSQRAIDRSLDELELYGFIRRIPSRARAIEILYWPEEQKPRSTYDQLLALVQASTVPAPESLKRVFLVGLKHIQPVAAKRAGHSSSSGRVGIHAAAGGSIPRGGKP